MANDKKIYRAGTIPYIVEDGTIKMMFMRPSDPEYGGDKFQIAKGKVEDGESTMDAALREAKEELGLFVGNVIATEEVGVFMGRTTVYVAKVKDRNLFGDPSFETSDTAWLSLTEFANIGRELHYHVVQAAHQLIENSEQL